MRACEEADAFLRKTGRAQEPVPQSGGRPLRSVSPPGRHSALRTHRSDCAITSLGRPHTCGLVSPVPLSHPKDPKLWLICLTSSSAMPWTDQAVKISNG
jgi:hypothetical protein